MKYTCSWPESLMRKLRGIVTSMTSEADSLCTSLDLSAFFKALLFPYTALVITSPFVSNCLLLFLLATVCNNCCAFSAAILASRTYKMIQKHSSKSIRLNNEACRKP